MKKINLIKVFFSAKWITNLVVLLLASSLMCGLNAHETPEDLAFDQHPRIAKMGELKAFPEIQAYVQEVGEKIAKASDYPDTHYHFIVLNSSIPNAWAFRDGTIAVTRGLVTMVQNEAQLASVLAHEMGHEVAYQREAKANDQENGSDNSHAFTIEKPMKILAKTASTVDNLIFSAEVREEESQADLDGIHYLLKAGYRPSAALDVQALLARGIKERGSWVEHLFDTHPSFATRSEALKEEISHFSQTGSYVGEEPFRKATDRLRKADRAYGLFDEGSFIVQANPQKALANAKEALKLVPNEAQFYGLYGEAEMNLGHPSEALKNLDKAITLDSEYYDFHLLKGILLESQQNKQRAIAELEKSNALYPTPIAHYILGNLYLENNLFDKAEEHYSAIVDSGEPFAEQASISLAKLLLAKDPCLCIEVIPRRTSEGFLIITATNKTPVNIYIEALKLTIKNAENNSESQVTIPINQILTSELSIYKMTSIGPFANQAQIKNAVKIEIISPKVP